MAVLDQSYRRWTGAPTGFVQRVLVLPRYDVLEIVSRLPWILACVACLVPPLILGGMAYVATNIQVLRALIPSLPLDLQAPAPGFGVYAGFLAVQCWLVAALAVLVGPPLVTRDFANGGMALFLSKSLRRGDYVLGRALAFFALLSCVSFVPYLLVFLMEAGMATSEWRRGHWGLPGAIVAGTLPTVLLLTMLVLVLGAIVQRAHLTRAALLFLVLGVKPLMFPLEAVAGTPNVRVLSPTDVTGTLRSWALEEPEPGDAGLLPESDRRPADSDGMSPGLALFGFAAWMAAGGILLRRRIRPVEVVR